jgi:hypothetical protein
MKGDGGRLEGMPENKDIKWGRNKIDRSEDKQKCTRVLLMS